MYGWIGMGDATTAPLVTMDSTITPSSFLQGLWTGPGQFLGLIGLGIGGNVNVTSAVFYGVLLVIGIKVFGGKR